MNGILERLRTKIEEKSLKVDARNATKNFKDGREKIVLLGDGK